MAENSEVQQIVERAVAQVLANQLPTLQAELVQRVLAEAAVPTVIDADALNSIAGSDFRGRGMDTILTPHPGEMARLLGHPVGDRLETARAFAQERNICLVLILTFRLV